MEQKERILSLKSIVRAVCLKWVRVLTFALICALLAGAYEGAKEWPLTHINKEQGENNTSSDDYSNNYELIKKDLSSKNRYLKESLIAQIDPNNEALASAKMYVRTPAMKAENSKATTSTSDNKKDNDNVVTAAGTVAVPAGSDGSTSTGSDSVISTVSITEAERVASNILNEYIYYSLNLLDWDKLAEEMDSKPQYLSELISVSEVDSGNVSATLSVKYKDVEGAKKILDYVSQQLESKNNALTDEYGVYEFQIKDSNVETVVDRSLSNWLNGCVSDMNNLMRTQDTFKTAVGALDPAMKTEILDKKTVLKHVIKYGILGFAGGAVIYFILAILAAAVSGKVLAGKDLIEQYGLKKLAVMPSPDPAQLRGFSKRVAGWGSEYFSGENEEQCLKIAAANIRHSVQNINKIALVGDLPEEEMDKMSEKLSNLIDGSTSILTAANINEDPDAIDRLSASDSVILVSRVNESRFSRIDGILRTVSDCGKSVLGGIVLGSSK